MIYSLRPFFVFKSKGAAMDLIFKSVQHDFLKIGIRKESVMKTVAKMLASIKFMLR